MCHDTVAAPEALKRPAGTRVEPGVTERWAAEPATRIVTLARSLGSQADRSTHVDVVADAYQAFQRDIHGFLRAAVRDAEAAEDLTQETFIRLVREVRAGRAPDNVRAWLYTVASHLVTSRARRAAVAERFKAVLAIRGSAEGPETYAIRGEEHADVRRALAKLPADARTVLLLAAHGFSGREIARVLGRSEGAARTLLCRSRVKLREQLTADQPHPEPPEAPRA
jgi:RNA polymerase sigma-70 factor (ECF subfamily)